MIIYIVYDGGVTLHAAVRCGGGGAVFNGRKMNSDTPWMLMMYRDITVGDGCHVESDSSFYSVL